MNPKLPCILISLLIVAVFPAAAASIIQLTDDLALDSYPFWSPDWAGIAFRSVSRNQTALWMVKSGGSDLEPLVDGDYMMHQRSPGGRGLAVSDGDDIVLVVPDSPATPGFEAARTLAAFCARPQAKRIVTTKYNPKRTMASPLACTTFL